MQDLFAVDVFAGGGGLTVGLKRAGLKVVGAVEVEKHAFATYKANHPEVCAFMQDVRTVKGQELSRLSPSGRIDLLAGCPPCQGFSSLTVKSRMKDPRNDLVLEMARLIEEIAPRAVMMENVPGLGNRGRNLFKRFVRTLKSNGYVPEWDVLQAADYGVPQNRRRLVLLAGKGFKIRLPQPQFDRTRGGKVKLWRRLRSVIRRMPAPITLRESLACGGPAKFGWHVVRSLSPQNLRRLEKAKPGRSRAELPDSLRPACHKGLDKGFTNVYGRMSWDGLSPTITGGCTTLSKGRFGHPDQKRTISVREAALIQTFPRDYIIDTPYMDYACDIVGNALPCDFAYVLARQCVVTMRRAEKAARDGR